MCLEGYLDREFGVMVAPLGLEHLEDVPTLAAQRQVPVDRNRRAVATDAEDHAERVRVVADVEIDRPSASRNRTGGEVIVIDRGGRP